jgi:uncharacterized membrane protein
LSDSYLDDAKKELSKKDENYSEKKQKIELLALYELAYNMKFEKVSKKLATLRENEISENNKNYYVFLKYLTSKALNSPDFANVEKLASGIEDFNYYIDKANLILSKRND